MPRDASGNYTLAAGNPVTSGTIIRASWANTTLPDIADALTNSLSRNGNGGMLSPLKLADGTVLLPSMAFTNSINTGLYLAAAGDMRGAAANKDIFRITTLGLGVWDNTSAVWRLVDPRRAYDTNVEFFADTSIPAAKITVGGTDIVTVDSTEAVITQASITDLTVTGSFSAPGFSSGKFFAVDGSAGAPSFSFLSDTQSGMWLNGNDLSFSRLGSTMMTFDANNVNIVNKKLQVTGFFGISSEGPLDLFSLSPTVALRYDNAAAVDGSGQQFDIVPTSTGGSTFGVYMQHGSNNGSGVFTRRNLIRMYDGGILFQDGSFNNQVEIVSSTGLLHAFYGLTVDGALSAASFSVTGQIQAPDGTVGAPSYSFSTSPTSGWYLSAANEVSLSTGATQAITVASDQQVTIHHGLISGDPGLEGSGIDIGGVIYDSRLKVSEITSTHAAQTILHKHSTTLPPILVAARCNSDTTAHVAVTNNMSLFSIYAAGYTVGEYNLFGSIDFAAASTGTISGTSSPGKLVLSTTADGAVFPTAALTIDSSQNIKIGSGVLEGVNGGKVVSVGSSTGAEIIAGSVNSGLVDNEFIAAFLFKNTDGSGTPPHYAGIAARANDVFGEMDLEFYTGRDNYELGIPQAVLDVDGSLRIVGGFATGGETAPDTDPGGICVQIAAATGNYITLKDSTNIAHGITSVNETDTFCSIRKLDNSIGGAIITGIAEATATNGIQVRGFAGAPSTSDTANGVIIMNAAKNNGTSTVSLAAAENAFSISSKTTILEITKGSGEKYLLGGLRIGAATSFATNSILAAQTTAGKLDVRAYGASSVKLSSSAAMGYNVTTGNTHIFEVNDSEVARVGASGFSFDGGSNYFDTYEEDGTVTTTATPNTSGTITLDSTLDSLSYTRIGNVVTVKGEVKVSSVSSPVGTYVSFSGLPYALANLLETSNHVSVSVTMYNGSTFTVVPARAQELSTSIRVYLDASTITSSHYFTFGFSYTA